MFLRPVSQLLGAILLVFVAVPASAAGVVVTGVVVPPPKSDVPPTQHPGFIAPIENPILELRPFDPLPECFVFLDGSGAPDAASVTSAKPVVWSLGSHSFAPPVLPVIANTAVEIRNDGRETHILYSSEQPQLVAKDPIGPSSSRTLTAPAAGTAAVIHSRSSPHLEGRLVAVPTRFFARVDRAGKFKIENVPAGHYTVKVWFRDGWLKSERPIDVPGKEVRIELTAADLAAARQPALAPASRPAASAPAERK